MFYHIWSYMQNTFAGRKRRRCGVCSACLAKDCQKCPFCRDKPKYRGEGKKKKSCIKQWCLCFIPEPSKSTEQPPTQNATNVQEIISRLSAATSQKGSCMFSSNQSILQTLVVCTEGLTPLQPTVSPMTEEDMFKVENHYPYPILYRIPMFIAFISRQSINHPHGLSSLLELTFLMSYHQDP